MPRLPCDDLPRDVLVASDVFCDLMSVEGLDVLGLLELSVVDDDIGGDDSEEDGGGADEGGFPLCSWLELVLLASCERTVSSD